MKIAWAGPWNERTTPTFGLHVVEALTGMGHEVEILRSETGDSLELPMPPMPAGRNWAIHTLADDTMWRIRTEYDVVVVSLGDHFGYYGALVPFLVEGLDAVVIFHDCLMANLCAGWAHCFPNPPGMLRAMVESTYGARAMPQLADFQEADFWLSLADMVRERPMLELFAPMAMGAVVHADHYLERVQRYCSGPVAKLALAYPELAVAPPREEDGAGLRVATVGHINVNKRAEDVIVAMGSDHALRSRCEYVLIGEIEPPERRRLEDLAKAHGVASIRFTGWVDDAGLLEELARVDVICCLRNPILEGGSGSVIMAMLSGRPVLVSDHGVYRELPDDLVLKCRPGAEAIDVARHLTTLLADRAAGNSMGARAREYAAHVHSPVQYARNLLGLIERAIPTGPIRRAARDFGAFMAFMGLEDTDPAAERVAAVLTELLGDAPGRVPDHG